MTLGFGNLAQWPHHKKANMNKGAYAHNTHLIFVSKNVQTIILSILIF